MIILFFSTTQIDAESKSGLDALLLPRVIIGFIFLLSISLFVKNLFNIKNKQRKGKFNILEWIKGNKEVLVVFISFAAYVALLPNLGFILSTLLFLFSLSILIIRPGKNIKSWSTISIYNISFTFIIYYIFMKVLNVMLPTLYRTDFKIF